MVAKVFNKEGFSVETRKISDDITVRGIALGEKGRGRHETFIPVPKEFPDKPEETVLGFSMGLTRSERPRLVVNRNGGDRSVTALLSSNGGYRRGTCGEIYVLTSSKVLAVATGYGAWGDAGRIGTWTDACIQFSSGWIRVKYSGHSGKRLYCGFCPDGKFRSFDSIDDLIMAFDMNGWNMPFKFDADNRTCDLDGEWTLAQCLGGSYE